MIYVHVLCNIFHICVIDAYVYIMEMSQIMFVQCLLSLGMKLNSENKKKVAGDIMQTQGRGYKDDMQTRQCEITSQCLLALPGAFIMDKLYQIS